MCWYPKRDAADPITQDAPAVGRATQCVIELHCQRFGWLGGKSHFMEEEATCFTPDRE
jgi:hypothetical protein